MSSAVGILGDMSPHPPAIAARGHLERPCARYYAALRPVAEDRAQSFEARFVLVDFMGVANPVGEG